MALPASLVRAESLASCSDAFISISSGQRFAAATRVGLSDEQQTKLGSRQYEMTLQQDRANIVSSRGAHAQVQRVAERIEAVAGRDKPSFDWDVTLIRKHEANAYCLPGGKIVVYTGSSR